jgi:hypothetical protein
LDKATDVGKTDAQDAFISYRNGLSQKFENRRIILLSAGAWAGGVDTKKKGELSIGVELQELKRILCE